MMVDSVSSLFLNYGFRLVWILELFNMPFMLRDGIKKHLKNCCYASVWALAEHVFCALWLSSTVPFCDMWKQIREKLEVKKAG